MKKNENIYYQLFCLKITFESHTPVVIWFCLLYDPKHYASRFDALNFEHKFL